MQDVLLSRFAVLGDIHAEDKLLALSLGWLRASRVERIFSVGDIVDGQGDADRAVALLAAHRVEAVRGNHERWWLDPEGTRVRHATPQDALMPRGRYFLEMLPSSLVVETVVGAMLVCHAVGDDDMTRVLSHHSDNEIRSTRAWARFIDEYPSVTVMVCGHTHERMVRVLDGVTIINAGTLHRHDTPGFAVVDLTLGEVVYHDLEEGGAVTLAERVRLSVAGR